MALGEERSDYDAVLTHIDLLARELCYIKALRERFTKINEIQEKLLKLRNTAAIHACVTKSNA